MIALSKVYDTKHMSIKRLVNRGQDIKHMCVNCLCTSNWSTCIASHMQRQAGSESMTKSCSNAEEVSLGMKGLQA